MKKSSRKSISACKDFLEFRLGSYLAAIGTNGNHKSNQIFYMIFLFSLGFEDISARVGVMKGDRRKCREIKEEGSLNDAVLVQETYGSGK